MAEIPDEQCLFLINGLDCPNLRDSAHFFCIDHRTLFASSDNRSLLEETARSMRELTYVSEDKKITAKSDRKLIDNHVNLLHEVLSRGYSIQDAMIAIADVIKEKGTIDDQLKAIGQDHKWKKFEKIIAGIHILRAEGAEVKLNDHIVGKDSKGRRQIDVSIRFKNTFYPYLTIIECKDTGRKVEIKEVSAFVSTMEDVGAQRGVMVSAGGFQSGAIGTAEANNIELFTLSEIKTDWTKKINAEVHTLPYPDSVEFDYPFFEASPVEGEGISIKYGEVLFYEKPDKPPTPLPKILHRAARYVVKKRLALPARVTVTFDPPKLYQFPTTTFYTPIYAVIINFVPTKLAVGYEIDMPPKVVSYRYSDLQQERVQEFRAEDIPKVMHSRPD